MSARQYRVVAVDDSEDDLLLLQVGLRHASQLQLTTSLRDGLDAIAYVCGKGSFEDRGRWPMPDLLIMDLKMPGVDGFGVLSWLSSLPVRPCKTVVLTSSLAESDRQRALGLGAEAVYIKPVDVAGYRALATALELSLTS